MKEIRKLRADEIDCRPKMIKENSKGGGCLLLLYKDARVDMNILDEVFGPLGWTREHTVINGNLFCTVSVWDDDNKQWVHKQDVGVESQTEKEKGEASDAFKRACVNVGIGRELYTGPFIWVNLKPGEIGEKNSLRFGLHFHVSHIAYDEAGNISELIISDQDGNERYKYGVGGAKPKVNVQGEVAVEAAKKLFLEVVSILGGDKEILYEKLGMDKNAVGSIIKGGDEESVKLLVDMLVAIKKKIGVEE
jgi:hypothetical protein